MRGNVFELAVAFILGVAFSAVVNSFVEDVLMHAIAAIIGQPDFGDLTLTLGDGVIRYGSFLNAVINFVIVAGAVFVMIKAVERAKKRRETGEEKPATTRSCTYCLTEIPIAASRCPACTSEVSAATT